MKMHCCKHTKLIPLQLRLHSFSVVGNGMCQVRCIVLLNLFCLSSSTATRTFYTQTNFTDAIFRHVGFHSMPIVCVNVDGYYDAFKVILNRAHDDELLYKHPRDIVHFEETPE